MAYHQPVLAQACIDALDIKPDGIYVDATYGGGGHSQLILDRLSDKGKLIAFDQDEDAVANLPQDNRFIFNAHNFRHIIRFLRLHRISQVDGVLADLGVSSHQLDEAERGFSFRFDAALDMRMNQFDDKTAANILNTYDATELQRIFSEYGEVRNSKSLALRIVEERENRPIVTISDFLIVIEPMVRGFKSRYLAQVFQALRIEVNDEMRSLEEFLQACLEVIKPGGTLVVLSYHSLEDRMVKNFIKTGSVSGEMKRDFFGAIERPFTTIYKGVITPSEEELAENPRARSAKMRAGIRN
jgi:16S rRNA (cytosine1402-N4)-methyltransferase